MLQSSTTARALLIASLRERKAELEATILTRIRSDGAPTEAVDPEYGEGLRAAIPTALDYCIEGIERGAGNAPPIPIALRSQARLAARNSIALDTVLRRYLAGYTTLGDFVIEEAETADLLKSRELKRLLRALSTSFDRLIEAVGEEHAREQESARPRGTRQRRAEQIARLLAGEPVDTPDLAYDLQGWHLGMMAKGEGALDALRQLARHLDRRLLFLEREEETVWAWLGGRNPLDHERLTQALAGEWPEGIRLAHGEPGEGIGGWRLSHSQARDALPIALCRDETLVRYRDVALFALVLRNDLLASSLRQIYLEPLEKERDGGKVLRETLRAYFETGGSPAAAAATLGTTRQTVTNRLRCVEERVGNQLRTCATELQLALALTELGP